MRTIAATLLLCLMHPGPVFAQASAQGSIGMTRDPFVAPEMTNVKFVILLGPDLKPGEEPFLDPYEMSRQPLGNLQVPAEAISVDVTTALPTKPGVSVQVRYPASSMDTATVQKLTEDIRLKAIRFGITQVEFTPTEEQKGIDVRVRIGLGSDDGMYGGMGGDGGIFSGITLAKYLSAAAVLNPENPTIELFDGTRMRANQDGMMGMEGYDGMDMGGYGMGGGGIGEPPAIKQPRWAEAEGTVSEGDLVVSWSLEQGFASAISLQSSGGWVRVDLNGSKMTQPVVAGSICAFYCADSAYAFSASVGRWDRLTLKSESNPAPMIIVDGQSATIKTDDDLHVFTAGSGRWASRSQAGNPGNVDRSDPFGGGADPFGGGADPFGGGADPFGTVSDPFSDPFGGGRDPFKNSPQAHDPFGPADPNQASQDPFAAPPRGQQSDDIFGEPPQPMPGPFGPGAPLSISDLSTQVEKLRHAREQLETHLEQLAKQYKATTDAKHRAAIKQQLVAMASQSFDLGKNLQTSETTLLGIKLRLIGEQVQLRERHRHAIIQQRVERLTAGEP